MKNQPPKILLKFFNWFCHPDLAPFVEGDLLELYGHNLKIHGKQKASRLFMLELMKLLRPSLIRKLEGNKRLNQFGMLKSYFKTALRNMRKNALFTTINIAGLAISMSVGILMVLFQSELSSFDDFHENKDRIYRVTSSQIGGAHSTEIKRASASYFIGNELKTKASGIEEVAILIDDLTADIVVKEEGMTISGSYASPSFFNIFSCHLEQGDPKTALADPNGIVLTRSSALKLFGEEDPIGQIIEVRENDVFQNATVTGVLSDLPINSHLRFDALVSLSTFDLQPEVQTFKTDPGELSDAYVYVLLDQNKEGASVNRVLDQLIHSYNQAIENPIKHTLQPMDTFVSSDIYTRYDGPTFSKQKSWVMIGLTFIVLLSACFNYTNLSLARALKRSKEVGIRKANGASRYQVFSQFMIEAMLLCVIAMCLGLCLFFVLRPEFLNLPNESAAGYTMFSLELQYVQVFQFLGLALVIGFISGLFPALFHSKLQIRSLFHDAGKLKLYKGISVRNALITIQFAMSIGLITAAVLINNQYQFALNYDHGYSTEDILTVEVNGDYIDLLENECRKMSEVIDISKSAWVLGVGGHKLRISVAEADDRSSRTPFLMNTVDRNYLEMHNISLLAGENFPKDLHENEIPKQIIVNEAFLAALDLGTPDEAIGKQIFYYGTKMTVVGVSEEVVSIGLTKKIFDSFAFIQTTDKTEYSSLNIKIKTEDLFTTIDKIEKVYKSLDPIHPFVASFYNDKIAKGYESRKGTYLTISFLALLAIVISTLGLLGMAVFTTENRMKEISIRKVLGAGASKLTLLLSKSFIVMTILAGLVAIPVTIKIANTHLLNDFWERAPIGATEILSGFLIVLAIGILTIGWQIRLAIIQNPIDLLRDE